ncbi:hypothetical protein [Candidatus Phytoplasma meliae]|nr:hypothetical protein [Candidatus Phytoplasma meliae]
MEITTMILIVLMTTIFTLTVVMQILWLYVVVKKIHNDNKNNNQN